MLAAFLLFGVARADPCRDMGDPQQCVARTGLFGYSCSWCATSRKCSGRRADDCAPECRAVGSLEDLRCPAGVATVEVASSPDFAAAGYGGEQSEVAYGFAGGGTRAFALAMGWTRGLEMLGAYTSDVNVGAVSGAAWFFGPYHYARTEKSILPEYLKPKDCSLESVERRSPLSSAPGRIILDCMERFTVDELLHGGELGDLWTSVIHGLFLAPFGIGERDLAASSDEQAASTVARNSRALANETFITPRRADLPQLFAVGSVMGPKNLAPLAEPRLYVPIAFGADRSGVAVAVNSVDYAHARQPKKHRIELGGLTETFAIGSTPLLNKGAEQDVLLPERLFSLADAVGVSSLAPASFVSQVLPFIDDVLISRELWAPNATSENFILGDGGMTENFGVVPLLQRGARRLVIFDASVTPLVDRVAWDPVKRDPTSSDMDAYLPSLFGLDITPDDEFTVLRNNYVFDLKAFAPLMAALQDASKRGTGAIAKVQVTTVENALFAVEGGREVELTVVYLDEPSEWRASLPEETQHELSKKALGKFRSFPFYSTFDQLDLSDAQVNLVANMATWTILQNPQFFPPPTHSS